MSTTEDKSFWELMDELTRSVDPMRPENLLRRFNATWTANDNGTFSPNRPTTYPTVKPND